MEEPQSTNIIIESPTWDSTTDGVYWGYFRWIFKNSQMIWPHLLFCIEQTQTPKLHLATRNIWFIFFTSRHRTVQITDWLSQKLKAPLLHRLLSTSTLHTWTHNENIHSQCASNKKYANTGSPIELEPEIKTTTTSRERKVIILVGRGRSTRTPIWHTGTSTIPKHFTYWGLSTLSNRDWPSDLSWRKRQITHPLSLNSKSIELYQFRIVPMKSGALYRFESVLSIERKGTNRFVLTK